MQKEKSTSNYLENEDTAIVNHHAQASLVGPSPSREPLDFHRCLPGYSRTPLIQAPELAAKLHVGQVWVKDKSSRFGLPAFKILGASWAVYQALVKQRGGSIPSWKTFEDLKRIFSPLLPLTLVAATDGNHGRAVAHVAALLGFEAHILVPQDMAEARIQAIQDEGARVTIVHGTYDDAIEQSAREASPRHLVISDTAWPGYEDVPRWVTDGYSTIFWEIDDQLVDFGVDGVDMVAVQIGVGGLATAVVQHYRSSAISRKPKIVGVEPVKAACVLESVRANKIVAIPGPHDSIMAGLNCGVPSLTAWPVISRGLDVLVAIEDDYARQSMRELAKAGVVAGETGGAGLGGIMKVLPSSGLQRARDALNITNSTHILVISTEGATDPQVYRQIVGELSFST